MKPSGDLRKMNEHGFDPSPVDIPLLLPKSMTKSPVGPLLDRTGRALVTGASANFRCMSIAIGGVAVWGIYYLLV